MIPRFLDNKLPHKSGVYLFKDHLGDVLYVGKALDLYQRVSSYFSGLHLKNESVKLKNLVLEIAQIDVVEVESELEALILEANLIKKYLPKFNVRLTDDKDYLYIKVTKELFPKVVTARKHELKSSLKYFGPFPSSGTVRDTLKALRRVFPWCNGGLPRGKAGKKACFYFHLGLCPGSCAGSISQKDYLKIIRHFIQFLGGKKEKLIKELNREMQEFSSNQKFEEAAKLKKTLDGIFYLTQPQRVALYLTNPNFLEEERKLALRELKRVLMLPKIPKRIEGYDISNIQGKEATGSMVVLTNGEVDKSQYRKFKIRISGKPNDVAMMKEMLSRRLKHTEWPKPDLIIVDGGLGQVNVVVSIIHSTYYLLPIYGLAKRLEWLYPPVGPIIKLSRKSPSLKLLQKLRDEAHRFAITYHRKLHGKMLFGI